MTVTTVEHEETVARIAELDDVTLVNCMIGLHAKCEGRPEPMVGAINENGAMATRVVFGEIARRWIPTHVLKAAFAAYEIDWPGTEGSES
jgi:hypothetical protein